MVTFLHLNIYVWVPSTTSLYPWFSFNIQTLWSFFIYNKDHKIGIFFFFIFSFNATQDHISQKGKFFLYSVFYFSWNYALLCHCVMTSISCRQWPGKFLDLEVEYLYGRFWTPGTYFVNESPSIRSSKFRWLPSTAKHAVTTRNVNMRVTEDGSFLFVER